MNLSHRFLVAVLLLGFGAPLAAQSQDSSLEKYMVTVTAATVPNRMESCRALLINDKGLVLTTWRNVCVSSTFSCNLPGFSTSAKMVGAHPSRDLALLQLDLSRATPQSMPKPAKLATSSVNLGDKIFLCQYNQTLPAIVSSETEPGSNPEYFWIAPRDPKAGAPFPGGYGGSSPTPDNWIMNLQGEVQGVIARVVVNGKVALRVIPVHDLRPEEFVPPAQKRPNIQKALELVQLADDIEKERAQNRYRPVPPGTYPVDATECLRMALAEDPTNKDVTFRMGIIRDDSKANSAPNARSLPDPTVGKSSDQVDAEFIRSRVTTAIEHLNAGRTKLGLDILKDVVATFPNNPETKAARKLLESLQSPK